MTLIDCPRCHGLKFNDQTGRFDKGNPNPTMRIDNVMGSSQMIYWKCNHCGYTEKTSYDDDQEEL